MEIQCNVLEKMNITNHKFDMLKYTMSIAWT